LRETLIDLTAACDDAADERLGEFAGSGSGLVDGPKQLEAGGVGSGILV
jgi:hypothetical protein